VSFQNPFFRRPQMLLDETQEMIRDTARAFAAEKL
jgi:hypothetical protein